MANTLQMLAGAHYNILPSLDSSKFVASSEDSDFPASNLGVERPSRTFKFNVAAADDDVVVDLDLLFRGPMEVWTEGTGVVPTGWTNDAGSTTSPLQEATLVSEGTFSVELPGTGGNSTMYRDILVRAGAIYNYQTHLRGAGTAAIRFQNLSTRNYYNSSDSWVSAVSDRHSTTSTVGGEANGFTEFTGSFAVESCGDTPRYVTIRVWLAGTTATAYADATYLWPDYDFISIHGHNLDCGISVDLRNSSDNFAADDVAVKVDAAKRDPSFYYHIPSVQSKRFVKVLFTGTNSTPIELGELVVGIARQLLKEPRHDRESLQRSNQIRNTTRSGEVYIFKINRFPSQEVSFVFRGSYTALEDLRNNLWLAADEGASPVVIVPDDSRLEVIFGHLREDISISRIIARTDADKEVYEYELFLKESSFGVSVAA